MKRKLVEWRGRTGRVSTQIPGLQTNTRGKIATSLNTAAKRNRPNQTPPTILIAEICGRGRKFPTKTKNHIIGREEERDSAFRSRGDDLERREIRKNPIHLSPPPSISSPLHSSLTSDFAISLTYIRMSAVSSPPLRRRKSSSNSTAPTPKRPRAMPRFA